MNDERIEDRVDLEGIDEVVLFVGEVAENTTVPGARISIGTGFISISFELFPDHRRLE